MVEQVTAAFVGKKENLKQKYKVRNNFVTSNKEIKRHCENIVLLK